MCRGVVLLSNTSSWLEGQTEISQHCSQDLLQTNTTLLVRNVDFLLVKRCDIWLAKKQTYRLTGQERDFSEHKYSHYFVVVVAIHSTDVPHNNLLVIWARCMRESELVSVSEQLSTKRKQIWAASMHAPFQNITREFFCLLFLFSLTNIILQFSSSVCISYNLSNISHVTECLIQIWTII